MAAPSPAYFPDHLMLYSPERRHYARLAFSSEPLLGEADRGLQFCIARPPAADPDATDDDIRSLCEPYFQEHRQLMQRYPQLETVLAKCVAQSPVPLDTEWGRADFLYVVGDELAADIEKATGLLGYVNTGHGWKRVERPETGPSVEVNF